MHIDHHITISTSENNAQHLSKMPGRRRNKLRQGANPTNSAIAESEVASLSMISPEDPVKMLGRRRCREYKGSDISTDLASLPKEDLSKDKKSRKRYRKKKGTGPSPYLASSPSKENNTNPRPVIAKLRYVSVRCMECESS